MFPLPPLPSHRPERLFWVLLSAAAAVRLFMTTRQGLYLDEVLNLIDSQRNLTYMLHRTVHPLHFALLRPFTTVSSSEFVLRLPSVLLSLAGMLVFYWIGLLIEGRRLALTLAGLWAGSQFVTFYSTDADYYAGMMCYSVLSVWGALVFIQSGRWWGVPVIVAASLANFFTHPFSGLFSGLLAVGIVICVAAYRSSRVLIVSRRRYFRHGRLSTDAIVPLVFAVIVLGGVGVFGGRIVRMAAQFLRAFQWGAWAHNLDFNVYFFASTFRAYGPSLISENTAAWLAAAVVFILFLLGLWWLFRLKSPLALLIPFIFAFTFFFIFNTGISRFFHIRYTSYLAPLYLIGVGTGILHAGEAVGRIGFIRTRRLAGVSPSTALIIVSICVLFAPFTLFLAFGPFSHWKAAEKILEREFSPSSRLYVFNNSDFEVARYYLMRAGHSPRQIVFNRHYPAALRALALPDLKRTAFRHPDTWFASHWTEEGTTHQPLLDWVERRFTLRLEAPSRNEISLIQQYEPERRRRQRESAPHQTLRLYRWNYPGAFLLPPWDLEIPLSHADRMGERLQVTSRHDAGLVRHTISATLLADQSGTYTLELGGTDLSAASGDVALEPQSPVASMSAVGGILRGDVYLAAGEQRLIINVETPESPAPLDSMTLRLYPAFTPSLVIQPLSFEAIQPTQDLRVEGPPDSQRLTLRRNGFVRYEFFIPQDGRYAVTIKSVNDRPGPVIWEVWVDDGPAGLLSFDANDGSPGAKVLPVGLVRGRHTLTLFFVNETPDDSAPADTNRDATITSVEIAPAPVVTADDRMRVSGALLRADNLDENGCVPFGRGESARTLQAGWTVSLGSASSYDLTEEDGRQILQMRISPEEKGGFVLGPVWPVGPSRLVLASVDLSCRNLKNHSVNMLLVFFDAQGRPVGQKIIYSQGLTDETDWVTFVAFEPIPSGVAGVAAGASLYQNSRMTSQETGIVRMRSLRIHDRFTD
ncbi:MAG: hypothetical protein Kow0059_04220 [Candidatus Sumerlaeia bacterium]